MSTEQGNVRPEGREGMVTVYDSTDRYLGCMGREVWERLLAPVAEQPNVQPWREQIERVRKQLASPFQDGTNEARDALDALTTQIEELERERDDALGERVIAQLDIAQARAEKAERALAEIRENALSWHGPLTDTGYERALAVIATWADAALRSEDTSDES